MAIKREIEAAKILGINRKLFYRVLTLMVVVGTVTGSLFLDELVGEANTIFSSLMNSPALVAKKQQLTVAESNNILKTIDGLALEIGVDPQIMFCPQYDGIYNVAEQAKALTGKDTLKFDNIVEDLGNELIDLEEWTISPKTFINEVLKNELKDNPVCLSDIVGTNPDCLEYRQLLAVQTQYGEVIQIFKALRDGRYERASDLAIEFDIKYRGKSEGCAYLEMPSMLELVEKIIEQEIGNKSTIAAQADQIVEDVSGLLAPEKCPVGQSYDQNSDSCWTRQEEIDFYMNLGCTADQAAYITDNLPGQNVKTEADLEALKKVGLIDCSENN